jgi:hypothetical protein
MGSGSGEFRLGHKDNTCVIVWMRIAFLSSCVAASSDFSSSSSVQPNSKAIFRKALGLSSIKSSGSAIAEASLVVSGTSSEG